MLNIMRVRHIPLLGGNRSIRSEIDSSLSGGSSTFPLRSKSCQQGLTGAHPIGSRAASHDSAATLTQRAIIPRRRATVTACVRSLTSSLGRADARKGAHALEESTEPVALNRWGGMRVKPEAILRQVSAEEREKIKADPHYTPAGPFSFGPGDMISDESNTPPRYEAAWRVFASLEAAYGAARVEAWAIDLTAAGGSVTGARVQETAAAAFGEDLSRRLQ